MVNHRFTQKPVGFNPKNGCDTAVGSILFLADGSDPPSPSDRYRRYDPRWHDRSINVVSLRSLVWCIHHLGFGVSDQRRYKVMPLRVKVVEHPSSNHKFDVSWPLCFASTIFLLATFKQKIQQKKVLQTCTHSPNILLQDTLCSIFSKVDPSAIQSSSITTRQVNPEFSADWRMGARTQKNEIVFQALICFRGHSFRFRGE